MSCLNSSFLLHPFIAFLRLIELLCVISGCFLVIMTHYFVVVTHYLNVNLHLVKYFWKCNDVDLLPSIIKLYFFIGHFLKAFVLFFASVHKVAFSRSLWKLHHNNWKSSKQFGTRCADECLTVLCKCMVFMFIIFSHLLKFCSSLKNQRVSVKNPEVCFFWVKIYWFFCVLLVYQSGKSFLVFRKTFQFVCFLRNFESWNFTTTKLFRSNIWKGENTLNLLRIHWLEILLIYGFVCICLTPKCLCHRCCQAVLLIVVFRLKDLTLLHLQHNLIHCVGNGLRSLVRLRALRLDNNRILRLDAREVSSCLQLTLLDISNNYLEDIAVSKRFAINKSHQYESYLRNILILRTDVKLRWDCQPLLFCVVWVKF